MDSLDNFRERLEAFEQQTKAMEAHTRTIERRRRLCHGMAGVLMVLSLVGLPVQSAYGQELEGRVSLLEAVVRALEFEIIELQRRIAAGRQKGEGQMRTGMWVLCVMIVLLVSVVNDQAAIAQVIPGPGQVLSAGGTIVLCSVPAGSPRLFTLIVPLGTEDAVDFGLLDCPLVPPVVGFTCPTPGDSCTCAGGKGSADCNRLEASGLCRDELQTFNKTGYCHTSF